MRNRDHGNQRMSERARMCSALTWTLTTDDMPRIGWLLDQSETGCAFAWRGDDIPNTGDVIRIDRGSDRAAVSERAIVKRVTVAHSDLVIIAVHVLQQFPVAALSRSVHDHAERSVPCGAVGTSELKPIFLANHEGVD